jgi:hypothetical protein
MVNPRLSRIRSRSGRAGYRAKVRKYGKVRLARISRANGRLGGRPPLHGRRRHTASRKRTA